MKSICVCQEAKSMGTKGSWREWTDEGGRGEREGKDRGKGEAAFVSSFFLCSLFNFKLQVKVV